MSANPAQGGWTWITATVAIIERPSFDHPWTRWDTSRGYPSITIHTTREDAARV